MKNDIIQREVATQGTTDIPSETMEARIWWNNNPNMLKEKKKVTQISTTSKKVSFQDKCKIKTFSDKRRL